MRKYAYLAAAAATALLTVLVTAGPAAAVATNVLTYTGSVPVPVGATLTANLKSGTTANFYSSATGTTGVKCNQSGFSAKVLTNPVAPGTATESLGTQTFSSCTSNVLGVISVKSIVVNNLPFNTSVNSSKVLTITGGTAGVIQTTVVLNTLINPNVTCVYQAVGNTLTGVVTNAPDHSIKLTNQQFTKTSGSGLCFNNGFFTVTYAPVTGPGGVVFVN